MCVCDIVFQQQEIGFRIGKDELVFRQINCWKEPSTKSKFFQTMEVEKLHQHSSDTWSSPFWCWMWCGCIRHACREAASVTRVWSGSEQRWKGELSCRLFTPAICARILQSLFNQPPKPAVEAASCCLCNRTCQLRVLPVVYTWYFSIIPVTWSRSFLHYHNFVCKCVFLHVFWRWRDRSNRGEPQWLSEGKEIEGKMVVW